MVERVSRSLNLWRKLWDAEQRVLDDASPEAVAARDALLAEWSTYVETKEREYGAGAGWPYGRQQEAYFEGRVDAAFAHEPLILLVHLMLLEQRLRMLADSPSATRTDLQTIERALQRVFERATELRIDVDALRRAALQDALDGGRVPSNKGSSGEEPSSPM